MKFTLVVLTPGKALGKVIAVTGPEFVIGTDPDCHLRPASADVKARHCVLFLRDGKAFVQDVNDTDKATINGVPVKGVWPLQNADRLKVGPLEFYVSLEADASTGLPWLSRPGPAANAKTIAEAEQLAGELLCAQEDSPPEEDQPIRPLDPNLSADWEMPSATKMTERRPEQRKRSRSISNPESAKKALAAMARKMRSNKP